jgi:hypothetical protein
MIEEIMPEEYKSNPRMAEVKILIMINLLLISPTFTLFYVPYSQFTVVKDRVAYTDFVCRFCNRKWIGCDIGCSKYSQIQSN